MITRVAIYTPAATNTALIASVGTWQGGTKGVGSKKENEAWKGLFMPTLTIIELERFCAAMLWSAIICGDRMIATLFDENDKYQGELRLC